MSSLDHGGIRTDRKLPSSQPKISRIIWTNVLGIDEASLWKFFVVLVANCRVGKQIILLRVF